MESIMTLLALILLIIAPWIVLLEIAVALYYMVYRLLQIIGDIRDFLNR